MYVMLGARARQEFETLGYGNVLNRPAEQTLEDFMIAQRQQYEDEPDDWEEKEEASCGTKPSPAAGQTKAEQEKALAIDDLDSDDDQ